MRKILLTLIAGIALGAIAMFFVQHKMNKKSNDPLRSSVLFNLAETEDYYFPTHDNLLIMDRSNAEASEAFIVQIAPGKFTHRHVHDDTEQLFYILSGKGKLVIERLGRKETFNLQPTNFVHVPRNCYHQAFCEGSDTLKYLAIDCFPFGHNVNEPSWDDHVKVICTQNGWDYETTRIKN